MNQNTGNNKKPIVQTNPLEQFREVGNVAREASSAVAKGMGQEFGAMSKDFMGQMFGPRTARKFSGEIERGENLKMNEVLSGQRERIALERRRIAFERRLIREERVSVEKKTNELKIQLSILQREIVTLVSKTEGLAEETQITAMQISVEPGIYHIVFFQKLFEFIKSFNEKIESASVWLHGTNKRASKKNMWAQRYKKYGAKYLLSGEHYVSRSAG
ncbi:hypothetical protein KKB40_00095 [Patescibacteria group bacterium]|nr:hypothetical protein [Patescibacteria group bacterium]